MREFQLRLDVIEIFEADISGLILVVACLHLRQLLNFPVIVSMTGSHCWKPG